jgi:hypothetical protein
MNNKIKTGIAVGIILILTVIIGGLFWFGNKNQTSVPIQNKKIQNDNSVSNTSSIVSTGLPIVMQDGKVDWYDQVKFIASPVLFKKGKASDLSIKAWEVGKMKSSGEKIIFVAIDAHDPGGVSGYLFVTDTNSDEQRLQPYARYSSQNFLEGFDVNDIDYNVVTSDLGFDRIISLEYPGFLNFNNMTFQYEGDKIFDLDDPFFYPEKFNVYKKIYSDKVYGNIFQNTDDGGIYLKSPVGIAKVYSLKMDFFDGNVPQVNWNDGLKMQDSFTYRGVGGCGGGKHADDVSGQVSIDELAPTGKTSTGDIVYEYKDKNAQYLKKWYQEDVDFIKNTGEIEGSDFKKNTTYDTFVSKHLVFFWKDPLGRLIRFVNTNYVFGGSCGKPVIYLYPEQTTKVSVSVMPTGGMTVSDPVYNHGWNVIADPNSNLTNLANGKVYPYLFWEGRGDSVYQIPKNGFVTSKENLESLLNDKLSQLGLNQKEAKDFKEFWLPKMLLENKPYYYITFVSKREIDTLAPLKITPRPDTIIRVLMDYKGLDNYENVPKLNIMTPQRKGFTVVEWGGVLK